MSTETLVKVADRVREAASTVAWRQWATLGSMAETEAAVRSMIDPEALVLITLSLSSHEKRFWDVLTGWSSVGVRLLSVQRMKNLTGFYPDSTRKLASEYAYFVHDSVGDRRWKSLCNGSTSCERPSRGKNWNVEIDLASAAALMVRLRRGIGVNMRADVLSVLLAHRGEAVSVRRLAEALKYTVAATRRAAEHLASAQFVQVSRSDGPDTYTVDPKAWGRLLALEGPPPKWLRWQELFEYLAAVDAWERSSRGRRISRYALEAMGKDLTDKHSLAFESSGIRASRERHVHPQHKGDSFEHHTLALCDWMVKHA
jgi:hypothetical protein